MGAGLTIEETTDQAAIMGVLSNPKIWSAITYDNQPVGNAELTFGDDHVYLHTKIDGHPVGVNYFHYLNPKMVELHPSVLPVYRPIYSYDSVRLGIDWMFRSTDIEKITVQIPECFGQVRRFALMMGFVTEGKFKNAYPKRNEMLDINLLGLTRLEWADL